MLLQPLAMAAGETSDFAIQAMQADAVPDSMTAAAEGQAYKCSRTKGCELGCCRLDDKGDSYTADALIIPDCRFDARVKYVQLTRHASSKLRAYLLQIGDNAVL